MATFEIYFSLEQLTRGPIDYPDYTRTFEMKFLYGVAERPEVVYNF